MKKTWLITIVNKDLIPSSYYFCGNESEAREKLYKLSLEKVEELIKLPWTEIKASPYKDDFADIDNNGKLLGYIYYTQNNDHFYMSLSATSVERVNYL